ncbi:MULTISPECIES: hydantoinase/oxoprolinase N-terminal domain-containing protein [unclassified Methanosarcina]|uniref:hydantoinase/oxoprolinase N-terminal domain-containing protein n=1 Tax=unclassified Methanosarcina TaxID=2644672 RepID=UPI0006157EF8|nr:MULTISPECIES: hydantoinase/oxoprolinase family protein [unclassified Methanosarcina]AKB18766.1 Hydantoinase [Methanosarcina sp. WWM596]AKB21698.1 Hydantoinase [Methanosarcina sp. WH1]
MAYSLGIDAGGTYTDSILLRNSDGMVVGSNKALTTYPDLLEGITNSIDGLDQEKLKLVTMVSVSTTLATNTILEKTGYPVGLVLVGDYEIPADSEIENCIMVQGGHNSYGDEVADLDISTVENFVMRLKDRISAFAVSSYFSVRNPEHELRVKALIQELTGLPVVCGHELAQSLGAYERGVTAYLNAQLLPVAEGFLKTVVGEIERRGLESRIAMLRCDGSVVSMHEAMKKPIESVFSGPAASLLGASYLSGNDTCAVIDVGGTSTDVSLIHKGLPYLSETGAVVGGWQTKVRALRMETSAMGGDSHIWVQGSRTNIGPRRVIPLCRAAVLYPSFMNTLKKRWIPDRLKMNEHIQATKFFVRTKQIAVDLSQEEEKLLALIGNEPLSLKDVYWDKNILPSKKVMDSLIQKRLVQAIGFTPTDALHVLGEYAEWNSEASEIGATLLANFIGTGKREFCINVKRLFAKNMARDLLAFLMEGVDRNEIEKMLEGKFFSRFKVDIPVVLLGGPVRAYVDSLKNLVDAEIIVPEYSNVGNAVGALVGKGTKRVEITVRTTYSESKYDLKTKGIFVYTPVGRRHFVVRDEALEFAEEFGRELILNYMAESGLSPDQVTINVEKKDIKVHTGDIPLETRFIFEGSSNSDVYEKAVSEHKESSKSFDVLEGQTLSRDCKSAEETSIAENWE